MKWIRFVVDGVPGETYVTGTVEASHNGVEEWVELCKFETFRHSYRAGKVVVYDFNFKPKPEFMYGHLWTCTNAGDTLNDAICTAACFLELLGLQRVQKFIVQRAD